MALHRWQGAVAVLGVGLLLAAAASFVAGWLAAREVQLSLHDADRQQVRVGGTGQEIKVLGEDGRVAIFAHPPSRLVWSLPLRPGTHRFEASVGIDAEVLTKSDGAGFLVTKTIWRTARHFITCCWNTSSKSATMSSIYGPGSPPPRRKDRRCIGRTIRS